MISVVCSGIFILVITVIIVLLLLDMLGLDIPTGAYVSLLGVAVVSTLGLLVQFVADCSKGVCL